ncbi:L-fuculose-phosphate aldolase [Sporomusaceae bacterium BoRhaA]|uniref:class II aldolase/adducin family protein n=1 Tax=Pelorhabdus rhamnosifermentans TaxID=2772457 RepID=UPI001C060F5A|nr:class II aldolase/adducin family protein [Pelorhabdus rhamnosifermentans]MBU2699271.1 L-fuculose-phosphate aldolase [Pelorhabdus rhamnosifermentans]
MLEDLKKELTSIIKKADIAGLCQHKSGNMSLKDEKSGMILVTPSGIAREDLTYEDICVVDKDAKIIEMKDNVKPSSELLMHLTAYKARQDIQAVVHTHSRFATSFAVLNKPIPPIIYEAVYYGGVVPVASYGRPGTKELAESIIEPLKQADACLLQSHGVMTIGKDIEAAYLKAIYVEEVAEVYYRTLMLNGGKEPPVLTLDELKKWKYPLDHIKRN